MYFTKATAALARTASSRTSRSCVVSSPRIHPPPWKYMTIGSAAGLPSGRTMRTPTWPVGPTGSVTSSKSAGGTAIGLDCKVSSRARASAIGSVEMGGDRFEARESTNACVAGSSCAFEVRSGAPRCPREAVGDLVAPGARRVEGRAADCGDYHSPVEATAARPSRHESSRSTAKRARITPASRA